MVSATISDSQAMPRLWRRPVRVWGSAPGMTTCRIRCGPAQVHRPRGLEGLAVDAADPGEGVEVEREQRRPWRSARSWAVSPMPIQMMKSEIRPKCGQRAQHLHRRVDGVLADPAETGDHGQRDGRWWPRSRSRSATRCTETRVAGPSVPSWMSSTALVAIWTGEASLRSARTPVLLSSCQTTMITSGETLRRRNVRRGREGARSSAYAGWGGRRRWGQGGRGHGAHVYEPKT